MNNSQKIAMRVVIALLIAVGIRIYFVQAFKMSSNAMAPALVKGDRLFVNKKIYRRADPQRGNIVVYFPPSGSWKESPDQAKPGHLIKNPLLNGTRRIFLHRIVGLPNETIEIKDGLILVNGAALKGFPYENIHYQNMGEYAQIGQSVKIPGDSYFILRDNSASSRDSRYIGFISRGNIIGKATRIFYPFNRAGLIR